MAELVTDPVCKMEINPEDAAGTSEYEGTTYYFCADGCKQEFDADPAKYLANGEAAAAAPATEQPAGVASGGSSEGQPAKRWWEFWKS